LESWPGVGPAVASRLVKLGVMRPEDLLFLLPLRYEDETRVTPVAQAPTGSSVLVEGRIVRVERKEGPRPQLVAHLDDGTGLLTGRWLHVYPGTAKRLEAGKRMRWFGEGRGGFFGGGAVDPAGHKQANARQPCADRQLGTSAFRQCFEQSCHIILKQIPPL